MIKKNKFTRKFIVNKRSIYILFIGILFVYQVFSSLRTISSGARLAQLIEEKENLTKENQLLLDILVSSSSLSNISEGAYELGFDKPQAIVYLMIEKPIAKAN